MITNHSPTAMVRLCLFLFHRFFTRFGLGCLKADVYKKAYHVIGRVGEENRDPMELIHMVGGVYAVSRAEGAEHLGRQFQIDNVDHLIAVKAKLAP